MEETALSLAKLIQLYMVRMGLTPSTPIARQVDLPNGLTFTELMYWLFQGIRTASEKAEVVLPTESAIELIKQWKLRK